MKIFKGVLTIATIFAALVIGCKSEDDSQPLPEEPQDEVLLVYELNEGYKHPWTHELETARMIWISDDEGVQVTEPVEVKNGEQVTILRPEEFVDESFTVHEMTSTTATSHEIEYAVLFSTGGVTAGDFIRKDIAEFLRGEEIGTATLQFSNVPEDITFKISSGKTTNQSGIADGDNEITLYENSAYAYVWFFDSNDDFNYIYVDHLEVGSTKVVDFNDASTEVDIYNYETPEGYSIVYRTVQAFRQSGDFLNDEIRLPGYQFPKNESAINDRSVVFSLKNEEDDSKSYAFTLYSDLPNELSLPEMDLNVINGDVNDLNVSVIGPKTYFDYRTILSPSETLSRIWYSITETPGDVKFPVLPQSIQEQFNVEGLSSFHGDSQVFTTFLYDHLDYKEFVERRIGRSDLEMIEGINNFSGYFRIID